MVTRGLWIFFPLNQQLQTVSQQTLRVLHWKYSAHIPKHLHFYFQLFPPWRRKVKSIYNQRLWWRSIHHSWHSRGPGRIWPDRNKWQRSPTEAPPLGRHVNGTRKAAGEGCNFASCALRPIRTTRWISQTRAVVETQWDQVRWDVLKANAEHVKDVGSERSQKQWNVVICKLSLTGATVIEGLEKNLWFVLL